MHFNPNAGKTFLLRIALAHQVKPCLHQSQRLFGWGQHFSHGPETFVHLWGFNPPPKSRKVNEIGPFGFRWTVDEAPGQQTEKVLCDSVPVLHTRGFQNL